MFTTGAFWFGIVIGYVTYRTLHHKPDSGITDIAAVIGAVGGAAVVKLFPSDNGQFDIYALGLAIGFFFYLLLSLVLGAVVGPETAKRFLGQGAVDTPGTSTGPGTGRRF